jgi:exonuclease III
MICIQEARLKAVHSHQRGRPLPSEYINIRDAIETIFHEYQPIWSLADTKYAGTLTLIHKRLGADLDVGKSVAFTTHSAINMLLQRFQLTRSQVVGLSETTTTTTTTTRNNKVSSPEKKAVKQTSMQSFFAPKKKTKATTTTTNKNNTTTSTTTDHHPEGRFQFISFESMDVLQTYVPNNGSKEESFQKRRDWDHQILTFLKERNKLLQHTNNNKQKEQERPLLWCGDLNVAMEHVDGTHWQTREDGTIYEWWTDETKCFVGGPKSTDKRAEDVGIPSFTPAERRRFREALEVGDLVDVWRALHPKGVASNHHHHLLQPWDRPNYTWRGHLGKAGRGIARYQGKGQRLDYFLLSPSKLFSSHVESCDILGYGERREGLFCGSDHCASLLKLNLELK